MSEPLLLGVRAFARELGIGRDATYTLIREGRLRAVHVNRRILIPRTELEAFVERESSADRVEARPVPDVMYITADREPR